MVLLACILSFTSVALLVLWLAPRRNAAARVRLERDLLKKAIERTCTEEGIDGSALLKDEALSGFGPLNSFLTSMRLASNLRKLLLQANLKIRVGTLLLLMAMLGAMGAQITRTAPHVLEVEGVSSLSGVEHAVIGDRIEAGTFAVAAAATGGEVQIGGFDPAHLGAFNAVLGEMGVEHEPLTDDGGGLRVRGAPPGSYHPVAIETAAYPGLATDLQAPLAVLMTQAEGESAIHETMKTITARPTRSIDARFSRTVVSTVSREGRLPATAPTPAAPAALALAPAWPAAPPTLDAALVSHLGRPQRYAATATIAVATRMIAVIWRRLSIVAKATEFETWARTFAVPMSAPGKTTTVACPFTSSMFSCCGPFTLPRFPRVVEIVPVVRPETN